MSREGDKGCVIPYVDVSVGGVIIPIDVVPVARKGGKDKNSWTGERHPRMGGEGGAAATGAGGWKNAGGSGRFSEGSIFSKAKLWAEPAEEEQMVERAQREECVSEVTRVRGRNQGQKRRPKSGRRILHGSSVWAKT